MPQEAFPLGEGGMRTTGLPGHLKKIEVVNFMCHENFAMEFGQVRSDGGDSCCSVCGAVLPALIKPIERLNIPQATPLKEEVVLVALPAPG